MSRLLSIKFPTGEHPSVNPDTPKASRYLTHETNFRIEDVSLSISLKLGETVFSDIHANEAVNQMVVIFWLGYKGAFGLL